MDSNLYNPDSDITEYQVDNYAHPKDWDFELSSGFDIPDSLIHLMTLQSQVPDEADPKEIYAVYLGDTNRIGTDTVILYCHGNYGHMDHFWQRAKLLASRGLTNRFGVMMFDYRGYGLSKGTLSENGMFADAQACMDWLESKGLSGDRLVLYGYSMGTAPAIQLTAHQNTLVPGWVIAEAPFASGEQTAQASSGLAFPGTYFTNLQLRNEDEIKVVQQPYMWIHGTADDYLDYETHGQVVYDNYQGVRGTAIGVVGAGHGNVPAVMGVEAYRERVLGFVLGR